MGTTHDFGTDPIIKNPPPANLNEAIRQTVNSLNSAPLEREYKMTVRQGYMIQRQLNKVINALAELSSISDRDF